MSDPGVIIPCTTNQPKRGDDFNFHLPHHVLRDSSSAVDVFRDKSTVLSFPELENNLYPHSVACYIMWIIC